MNPMHYPVPMEEHLANENALWQRQTAAMHYAIARRNIVDPNWGTKTPCDSASKAYLNSYQFNESAGLLDPNAVESIALDTMLQKCTSAPPKFSQMGPENTHKNLVNTFPHSSTIPTTFSSCNSHVSNQDDIHEKDAPNSLLGTSTHTAWSPADKSCLTGISEGEHFQHHPIHHLRNKQRFQRHRASPYRCVTNDEMSQNSAQKQQCLPVTLLQQNSQMRMSYSYLVQPPNFKLPRSPTARAAIMLYPYPPLPPQCLPELRHAHHQALFLEYIKSESDPLKIQLAHFIIEHCTRSIPEDLFRSDALLPNTRVVSDFVQQIIYAVELFRDQSRYHQGRDAIPPDINELYISNWLQQKQHLLKPLQILHHRRQQRLEQDNETYDNSKHRGQKNHRKIEVSLGEELDALGIPRIIHFENLNDAIANCGLVVQLPSHTDNSSKNTLKNNHRYDTSSTSYTQNTGLHPKRTLFNLLIAGRGDTRRSHLEMPWGEVVRIKYNRTLLGIPDFVVEALGCGSYADSRGTHQLIPKICAVSLEDSPYGVEILLFYRGMPYNKKSNLRVHQQQHTPQETSSLAYANRTPTPLQMYPPPLQHSTSQQKSPIESSTQSPLIYPEPIPQYMVQPVPLVPMTSLEQDTSALPNEPECHSVIQNETEEYTTMNLDQQNNIEYSIDPNLPSSTYWTVKSEDHSVNKEMNKTPNQNPSDMYTVSPCDVTSTQNSIQKYHMNATLDPRSTCSSQTTLPCEPNLLSSNSSMISCYSQPNDCNTCDLLLAEKQDKSEESEQQMTKNFYMTPTSDNETAIMLMTSLLLENPTQIEHERSSLFSNSKHCFSLNEHDIVYNSVDDHSTNTPISSHDNDRLFGPTLLTSPPATPSSCFSPKITEQLNVS